MPPSSPPDSLLHLIAAPASSGGAPAAPGDAMAAVAALFAELGAVVVGLSILARVALKLGITPIPFYLVGGLFLGKGGVYGSI